MADHDDEQLCHLAVDLLDRGRYQPRTVFNAAALKELAASFAGNGVVEPLVVRPKPDGRYEIVAGERRWRAAQIAGLHTVPAVVRQLTDEQALMVALIENVQREPLRPVEEARAVQRLVGEFGFTHDEAAERLGWSREQVTHSLRLLQLTEDVQRLVDEGEGLSRGHAKILASLPPARQRETARLVLQRGWSVRQLESHCRPGTKGRAREGARGDPDIRRLEEELSERFGAPVRIDHTQRGSGDLVIHYHDLEILDGILALLRKTAR